MRRLPYLIPILLMGLHTLLGARVLEVSSGGTYTNLEAAAADALPGDTIMFRAGTYAGGQFVADLQGNADAWITIMAATGEQVILDGGTNAWQISDPAYLRIMGFILQGQTGNGLNIDDGGTFDTPAHHIIIDHCTWRSINATGNNDMLKMSGIDSFTVSNCTFSNGSPGGSMIDMVGCHDGVFEANIFITAGSNCIQAKGGTRNILIRRNLLQEGGSRAINIGGSTDLEFFRPQGTKYEAAEIHVYSNVFFGADAPIAFVGAVNSDVVNNTFYLPKRWAIRILQETTEPGFLACGDNSFINNIVYLNTAAADPTINIGPDTRPESFTFSNNMWYNADDANWNGPNLPVTETDGMVGVDPKFRSAPGNLQLDVASPAIGAGKDVDAPKLDFFGRPYNTPRSIGATEGNVPPIASVPVAHNAANGVSLGYCTLTADGSLHIPLSLLRGETIGLTLWDELGRLVGPLYTGTLPAGEREVQVAAPALPSGLYHVLLTSPSGVASQRVMVVR